MIPAYLPLLFTCWHTYRLCWYVFMQAVNTLPSPLLLFHPALVSCSLSLPSLLTYSPHLLYSFSEAPYVTNWVTFVVLVRNVHQISRLLLLLINYNNRMKTRKKNHVKQIKKSNNIQTENAELYSYMLTWIRIHISTFLVFPSQNWCSLFNWNVFIFIKNGLKPTVK